MVIDTLQAYVHRRINLRTFDDLWRTKQQKRKLLWDCIRELRETYNNHDWIIVGDFNEICLPTERDEHGSFDMNEVADFNQAIQGLIELPMLGSDFT